MSRRFTLQILLPVEGYEEDKIYKSDDIYLRVANLKQKPDDVYYRCLKEKSVYASFDDVVKFACEKYSLGEIHNFSVQTDYFGEHKIVHEGNRYTVTTEEAKQLEREHITESVYCNVFKEFRLSWFYTSIGDELLPEDMAIEDEADGEDKFMASLILAKEIASRVNGRAVLWYD